MKKIILVLFLGVVVLASSYAIDELQLVRKELGESLNATVKTLKIKFKAIDALLDNSLVNSKSIKTSAESLSQMFCAKVVLEKIIKIKNNDFLRYFMLCGYMFKFNL